MELPVKNETPQAKASAVLKSHVLQHYGVEDADPIALLAEFAWDPSNKMSDRIRCAIALLPYVHQAYRPVDFVDPNKGPDFIIQTMGPVNVTPHFDNVKELPEATPATVVPLHDADNPDSE